MQVQHIILYYNSDIQKKKKATSEKTNAKFFEIPTHHLDEHITLKTQSI